MIIILLQFHGKFLSVLLLDLNQIMSSLTNSLILLLVWFLLFPEAAAVTDYSMIA